MSSSRYNHPAFREAIAERLHTNRPALSDSSLKTYVSSLYNIAKKLNLEPKLASFDDEEPVLKLISEYDSPQTRKSHLSGLYVLTGKAAYREEMIKGCQEVQQHYASQKMTAKEAQNRITLDDVRAKYAELLDRLKREPVAANYVNVLIVGLMGGIFMPVRRNEWGAVKVRDFDKATDNWLNAKKMEVTFNVYKTADKYGPQTVKIPIEVVPILRKWLKVNTSAWLLPDAKGGQLESWALSKRLKQIFGGLAVGVNQLRSLFVSRDANQLNRLKKEAAEMGHSLETHIDYIRQS